MLDKGLRSDIDDIDLAAAIAAALHCHVSLTSVMVGVSEGVVTLEGPVPCAADRKAAESVVRRFAGVRGLELCLTVQATASEDAKSAVDHPALE